VVGDDGLFVRSLDGGRTWEALRTVPGRPHLGHVWLESDRRGWACGRDGVVLRTTDGGLTWRDARPYARSRPPLVYLLLALAGLLLVPLLLPRRPIRADEESVADLFISDRPMQPGDPDPLDLGRLARGISRFLRNESTQAPLTIAVTGAWGTGKSSLMNLVRGDLEEKGVRPVAFNVWHHQKEQHLLAALLENVRRQAVPSVFTWPGLRFRARLLWIRGGQNRVMIAALLALFASGSSRVCSAATWTSRRAGNAS
jgi:hypothetical protein